MIEEFTKAWFARMHEVRAIFQANHPSDYSDVVKAVVSILGCGNYSDPDPERIHCIDDGGYQGTLVFIIGAKGYQPSKYWYVKIDYGSCSVCDTLEGIRVYGDKTPSDRQVSEYMQLARRVVQGLRLMNDDARG